jgi:hypothetical protein
MNCFQKCGANKRVNARFVGCELLPLMITDQDSIRPFIAWIV